MPLTPTQQQAVAARGNVLVVAGAGTGKTHTLVERCLACLLDQKSPVSVDEILMVTFTDAAAAEMRRRIRARLEEQLRASPDNPRWSEQLALFETAHIGTLHSFCLQLVRQHFYALELDPQLTVLAEEEAHLLADEELGKLFQAHYAGQGEMAMAVQQLIQDHAKGWEKPVRSLVLRLHHYSQTLPHPTGWFRRQLAHFSNPAPIQWQAWLTTALEDWRVRSISFLDKHSKTNHLAAQALAIITESKNKANRTEMAELLQQVSAICHDFPHGKKGEWQKPLEGFLADTDFLFSLAKLTGNTDPLTEDWNWIRSQMLTLLQLTQDFGEAYAAAKRELAMVDFHDLEQHVLRLLWDNETDQPSSLAHEWRNKLRFIFVDEYQDINAAQDKIIETLSGEGRRANRFLVGDVKQSIYRFRLADPTIFQNYFRSWSAPQDNQSSSTSSFSSSSSIHDRREPAVNARCSQTIPLPDNFRSREGILNFINSLFSLIMRADLGGVEYDEQARLRFGDAQRRNALSAAVDPAPRVELHLRLKSKSPPAEIADEESAHPLLQLADLEDADKDARLVALRLRELKAQGHKIWDETSNEFRPMEWRDVAVLLRSPARKAESYAKEFARLNVPLLVARGGFYQSLEIMDLLSLLQILDNPLQDVPILAVLRSPFVGLTLNELAQIRLARKGHFWNALVHWELSQIQNATGAPPTATVAALLTTEHGTRDTEKSDTLTKVSRFLSHFGRWRRLARQVSLSQCLNAVVAETHYASWLLTQPRGEQRHANVQRLLGLAQQFDQFQRHGLFRFLLFIEAQQLAESEPDVASVIDENSVRLMSIHQSKGLEFPVVVAADLGKSFNLMDLRADIILDQEFGLCPNVKPPHTGKRYPSLPHWLAARRQLHELLGEELRLLYVALTRARDTLLLSGSIIKSRFERLCQRAGQFELASARCFADWLSIWFTQNVVTACGQSELAREGQNTLLRWVIHDDSRLLGSDSAPAAPEATLDTGLVVSPEALQALRARLDWKYPFLSVTHEPAKTTVSTLRRRAATDESEDEDAIPLFWERESKQARGQPPWRVHREGAGQSIGKAHHAFLQLVSLSAVGSVAQLKLEAERLLRENVLTKEQAALLDYEGLAAFWQSTLGQKVLAKSEQIRRELPFTARFSLAELNDLLGKPHESSSEDEFVVVQGIADLVVMLPDEIWLIDFKTDSISPDDLADKTSVYEPQIKLYANALARIYARPVSKSWLYFLSARQAVELSQGTQLIRASQRGSSRSPEWKSH
jgi:ATP-dependent helicase/nuclease subunit A